MKHDFIEINESLIQVDGGIYCCFSHRIPSDRRDRRRVSWEKIEDKTGQHSCIWNFTPKATNVSNKNQENKEGFSIVEQDGLKWIRIKIYDEDFLLSTKDFIGEYGFKDLHWQEAVDETNRQGLSMPTKKQWNLIDAYREQIDKLLNEAGGDSLDSRFWCSERNKFGVAWTYVGYTGRIDFPVNGLGQVRLKKQLKSN